MQAVAICVVWKSTKKRNTSRDKLQNELQSALGLQCDHFDVPYWIQPIQGQEWAHWRKECSRLPWGNLSLLVALTVDRLLDTREGIESNLLKHYRYKGNRSRKISVECGLFTSVGLTKGNDSHLHMIQDMSKYYIHMFVKRAVCSCNGHFVVQVIDTFFFKWLLAFQPFSLSAKWLLAFQPFSQIEKISAFQPNRKIFSQMTAQMTFSQKLVMSHASHVGNSVFLLRAGQSLLDWPAHQ
jgi:hypothetical protein